MPPPSSPSERREGNEQRGLSHNVRRFRNASTESFPTLNSLNVISDLMLRDENSMLRPNEERFFRARILRHFNDINRLQTHFNRLINREGGNHQATLELNNIPSQLRNLSRELSRSERREAYLVESGEDDDDEDDQSFHYEEDANAGLVYYSDEDNNEDEMSENDDEDISGLLMEESGISVQPHERLLLTSARSPQTARTPLLNSSIPLRRQNAIRIRSMLNTEESDGTKKSDSRATETLDLEAKLLQKEIHSVLETIERARNESSLFPSNLHKPFSTRYFSSLQDHMQGCLLDGNTSADQMMDDFLWKRVNKMLFLRKQVAPSQPPPQSSKKRTKRYDGPSSKRQKTNPTENPDLLELNVASYPYTHIDKNILVDGLHSSYFQSGSSYRINLDCPEPNICDIKFGNVNSIIDGVFNIEPAGSLESLLLKLHNFAKFFCGMSNNSYQLPKNKILIRKLNVLDRISVDDNVCFKKLNVNTIHVPFTGKVVDFKTNDLRFLNLAKPLSARFNSNKVKVQLSEWMKINPFVQFRETFFHNFLQHLEQDLSHFSEIGIRKSKKKEALHLTKEFKSNLSEITKDFGYLKDTPISECNDKRRCRRHNDIFVEDWERNLALKLAEVVTKEDCETLINLQLNYALFTIEVDISKYLDTFFNAILLHTEGDYIDNYKKVYNNILKDEAESITAVLLCSINKQTGKLEAHNTFPHLYHRHMARHSTGIILTTNPALNENTGRNTYVYDDFDLFQQPAPVNSDTFNIQFFNNQPEETIDKLTGYMTLNLPVFDTV